MRLLRLLTTRVLADIAAATSTDAAIKKKKELQENCYYCVLMKTGIFQIKQKFIELKFHIRAVLQI